MDLIERLSSDSLPLSKIMPMCREAASELIRLRAINTELVSLLPGALYMDPPDGGDATVVEQFRRMAKDAKRYRRLRAIVDRQAEDEGLWFVAQTASEAYLQAQLRLLHAVIEDAGD